MHKLVTLISLIMVCSCYALKVMSLEIASDSDNQLQTIDDIRLPVDSKINAGIVNRHPVSLVNFSWPLFVIGDDAQSRDWLVKHAVQMKDLHALGFVANVKTKTSLHQLEQIAGVPLMPVNVDDLSDVLQVNHYPFVFESGVVWQ